GATSIVYKVNFFIVVKCPTTEGHEDFVKENRIFDILTKHPPCPELVASFLRFDNANFLEYMSRFSLSERLQRRQIRDPKSTRVSSVQSLEPLPLRKTWMKALAEGAAWLESLGLAHGDLKPENVLVDEQDRVKIADFDCTNTIGSEFEACIPPYGRLLGSEAGRNEGTAGKLGARTEQFALGSLFYYINYGVEVYDDQDFGKDHGPAIVERLQRMMFPNLDNNTVLDSIINDCWHGRFPSVAVLSESISQQCDLRTYSSQAMLPEEFAARRAYCLQLVEGGI
ncbi:kinase-like domain-containing protein, partial [Bisporella sp. PMI_857]